MKNITAWLLTAFVGLLIFQTPLSAQRNSDFEKRIANLSRNPYIKVSALKGAKDQNAVPIIVLSKNAEPDRQPALCLIAGTDARLPYTTDLALALAERYANALPNDSLWLSLTDRTLYILPNVSPVAFARFSQALHDGSDANDTPFDDDRDGKTDEDPAEDLNHDGIISYMRVADSTGNYSVSRFDGRIMIPIQPEKVHQGTYKLYLEGKDNDGDGKFNEDGIGGTTFNRNFTLDYKWFKPYSGREPFSESETKNMVDFFLDRKNIQIVFIVGQNNNLSKAWEFNAATSNGTVVTTPKEKDAKIFSNLSESYLKTVPYAKGQKDTVASGGDLLRWAYFHGGRWAVGSPAWWIPKDTALTKSLKNAEESEKNGIEILRWREKNGFSSAQNWQEITHPDFPNRKVEVGGFPAKMSWQLPSPVLDTVTTYHQKYIHALVGKLPRLSLHNLKIESRGSEVYEISLEVKNEGYLPTCPQIAENFTFLPLISYDLNIPSACTLISGNTHKTLPILPAQGSHKITWTVQGKGNFPFKAGAPNTGYVERIIELK